MSEVGTSGRRGAEGAILLAGAALAVGLLLPALDAVPLWDGWIYATCVQDAARHFSPEALSCALHPTHAWVLVLSVAAALAPGSALALHLAGLVLLALGLDGVRRLLARVLPGPEHAVGRALVVVAVAVHPVVLASLVHTNPDFGVFALVLAAVGVLAEERVGLASVLGVAACFTKELAVAIWAVVALGYLGLKLKDAAGRRLAVAREHWALLVPVVVMAVFFAVQRFVQGSTWHPSGAGHEFAGFAPWYVTDPALRRDLAEIFVLGFMWLPTLVLLADAFVATARRVKRLEARPLPGADAGWATLLGVATALVVAGLTSYRTFGNVRYYTVLFPLLLATAFVSLVRLGVPREVRHLVALVWIGLFTLGAWRSVDPVSRWVFGTLPMGERSLYAMTSVTRECCGYGRDQLAYNLEFTAYDAMLGRAYAETGVTSESLLVVPDAAYWQLSAPLDPKTRRRTLPREGPLLVPRMVPDGALLSRGLRPPEFLYLAPPNAPAPGLRALQREYEVTASAQVEAEGFTLPVYRLERRAPPAPR